MNEELLGPGVREILAGVGVQPPLELVSGSAASLLDTTCVHGRKGRGWN